MLPHYSASSFSLPHPGSSSALGAGIGSGVPASFGGGAASTTSSSSSKNVQRPAVFDKVSFTIFEYYVLTKDMPRSNFQMLY
jgi:hypothetical protein